MDGISTQLPLLQSQYRQLNNSNMNIQNQLNSLSLHSPVISDATSPSRFPTASTPHQSDDKLVTSSTVSVSPIHQATQSGLIGKPGILEIKKDAK